MDGGLVTVVVVDAGRPADPLAGSGDETGTAAMEDVLDSVRERMDPYGGRPVFSVRGGLTVTFPAPRQAVAFAAAVQAALAGRRPPLRIGIDTGEVLGPSHAPVGTSVDAAARIAAKAAGGELLVSDVVRQLVGSMPALRFVDRGRTRLEGLPGQWHLYSVAGLDRDPPVPPVFGRAAELAALDWALAGLAEGNGRILVLEGEAGIGKTHLVGALVARASAAGATVLRGGGDEIERDRPARILLSLTDPLDVPVAGLLANADGREGSRGFAVVEAVVDAVENLAVRGPVVVVAEDLHWADELSLRGIAALARRVAPLPITLVASMRPAPRSPLLERVLDVLAGRDARHLRLAPLDDVAVASIVASLTGAAPGPTLGARLAGTGGNPLFVVELVRALDHEGALRVEGGVAETGDQALPATVRDSVVRRVASMAPATVDVLRLASLLGSEFSLVELAVVAGQSVVAVAAHLHEAVDAGVLTGEGDTLSFRHDLIREAIYDHVAPAIRRDLHAAAGRALSAAGAPVAQVARQFALGARPGDLDAVEWLERAAHEASAVDPGTAVSLFRRALDLAPPAWPLRWRLETALLEPLALSGRVDEARTLAGEVVERVAGGAAEFAARRALAAVFAAAGDLRSASRECEAAAAIPGAPPGDADLLRVAAAGMAILFGRPAADVRRAADDALARAAERDDPILECWAQQTLCLVALAEARYDEALARAAASREIFHREFVPSMGFLIPDIWESTVLNYLDRLDESTVALAAAWQRAERRGDTAVMMLVHGGRTGRWFFAGRLEEAQAEVDAALTLAAETGGQSMTLLAHALAARFALVRGELATTEEHLAAAHQVLAGGGHLFGADILLWTQAAVFEAQGDPAAALALLAALWDQTEGTRYLLQYRNFGPDLVRLARDAGDDQRASAVAGAMEEAARRSSAPSAVAAALLARGLADRSPELLLDAVDHYRRTPRVMDLADACEHAAAALAEAGDTDAAAKLLDEAAELYLEAGATRLVARVDAALRACGVPRRRSRPARATHGWESLSPKEREVVGLVAEGLSNPEIGARLFVSRRTVETHLSHVFRKLGVSNRAQLAAAAARGAASDGGLTS